MQLGPVLTGIRVLDLTQQLSGPYGAMVLADLGAEVVKVEAPQRPDRARSMPSERVGGQPTYYLSLNRNKRSVTLDLKHPAGLEAFLRLVEAADVVLENFRPGVSERLGIDHDQLARRNPGIVTCSLSGFGETGPERDRPGYDYLMQALAGTMSLTGDPDGPPTKYGISVVDHVGGLFAVVGILAALASRTRDGEGADHQPCGRHIDVGLLDTHLSLLTYIAADLLNGGPEPVRQRSSAHPTIVPAQAFRTADGHIVVMPLAEHFWPPLCEALDLARLAADPRFADTSSRLAHREELLVILEGRFLERTTAEWTATLSAAGVPAAPVQSVSDALKMKQVQAREMVVELEHPAYGRYRAVGNPLKISDSGPQRLAGAPPLGQDTVDVLTTVAGMTAAEVEALRRAGAA